MSRLSRLLQDLKRRRVYRAAAVYLVAGWAAVQIVATVQPYLAFPPVLVTVVIVLVTVGFPVAIGLAWAFDVDAGGITRTPPADEAGDDAPGPARAWPVTVALLLVLLVGGSLALAALRGRWSAAPGAPPPAAASAPAAGNADVASIAVLPFQNLSQEKSAEYFSDGIADEILTNLASLSGVKVISHTSVMQYRNTLKPTRQIGSELGVATVLEGSVQQVGTRVRIEAQLIDARTDRHLWADRYDRELKDVFAVESEVAERIAQALKARLTPAEHARLVAARAPVDPEAHRLYLQGRAFWYGETEPDLRRAETLLRQAVALDSTFALAYSALADVYCDLGRYGDTDANVARCGTLARRALALDSTLAEPHDALGYVAAFYHFDLTGGERELRRAIALNPGYAVAHSDLGLVLAYQQRLPEALRERRIAAELDPLTSWTALGPVSVLLQAGRNDEALAAARETSARLPDSFYPHQLLGDIYRRQGRPVQAAAEYRQAIRLAPGDTRNAIMLAVTDLALGRRAQAEAALARYSGAEPASRVSAAVLAAQLGRKDQAFALLDRAVRERGEAVQNVPYNPDLAPLRGDPRFQAIARRLTPR